MIMGTKHKEEKTVFKSQDKLIYRIPALLYDRDKEILMAFAEQRSTSDDTSTEALVMRTGRVHKDETTHEVTIEWSELQPVEKAHLCGHRPMNPCPVYEKTSQTLFLFFICVSGTTSEEWQLRRHCNKARLCYVKTENAGQSWSDMTDLTDALAEIKCWATFAVGPGHGLQTEDGRLIVPLYAYTSSTVPHALYLYSDNKGETWQLDKMLQSDSGECVMAEVSDGTGHRFIYCNACSKGGYRVEACGTETGLIALQSAEKLVETGKGCQGSVVSFPAQSEEANAESEPRQKPNEWLLFTHPSSGSKRAHLGVYLNKCPSNPNAWTEPWIINDGPSGYSDLAYIDDGWFACLMECGEHRETEQIAYKVFSYKEVKQGVGE